MTPGSIGDAASAEPEWPRRRPRIDSWRLPLVFQSAILQAAWVGARLMIGYRALDLGAGALGLGLIAASFAVPALLSALPAGRLADRIGGIKLVVAGIVILAVGITCSALHHRAAVAGRRQRSASDWAKSSTAVGQQSFVAERADRNATDSAFGFLTSAISLGQVAGPLIVTSIATAGWRPGADDPDTTLALVAAAILVLLALPACRLLISRTHQDDTRARQRVIAGREPEPSSAPAGSGGR